MALTLAEKTRVKDAFNEAARNAPFPDQPVMILNGKQYSIKKMAAEVHAETEFGRSMFEMFDFVRGKAPLTKPMVDRIIDRFVVRPPQR